MRPASSTPPWEQVWDSTSGTVLPSTFPSGRTELTGVGDDRYSSAITLPTEITAAALMIDYWPGAQVSSNPRSLPVRPPPLTHAWSPQHVNQGAWIGMLIGVTCCFNFISVRAYGEAEFWLVCMKLVTLVGLLIIGIIITAGGVPGTDPIGFQYW